MLKPKGLTIGLVVLIIQLFLWVNVTWIFGAYAPAVERTLLLYLLMQALTLAVYGGTLGTDKPSEGILQFIIGFSVTSMIMLPLVFIAPGVTAFLASFEVVVAVVGFGMLYAFVKAYVEELVFRDILPLRAGLGDIASSILFGGFHASALMLAIPPKTGFEIFIGFALLATLGYIWAKVVRDRIGIMGATGSHTAYNLFVLGVLASLFI